MVCHSIVFSPSSSFTTIFPHPLYSHFSCCLLSCFIPSIIISYIFYSVITSTGPPLFFFPVGVVFFFFGLEFYGSNTAIFRYFHITKFMHFEEMLFFEILSIRWLVQASGWRGLVEWGGEKTVVVKTRISHQKKKKITKIWKNCIISEASGSPRTYVYVRISVLGNLSVVLHDHYVEIYWNTKSCKYNMLPPFLDTQTLTDWSSLI